jgi:hypothetical protein
MHSADQLAQQLGSSGGQCTIPARIAAEIRAGRCACAIRNPSGACCLGEVNRAVEEE